MPLITPRASSPPSLVGLATGPPLSPCPTIPVARDPVTSLPCKRFVTRLTPLYGGS